MCDTQFCLPTYLRFIFLLSLFPPDWCWQRSPETCTNSGQTLTLDAVWVPSALTAVFPRAFAIFKYAITPISVWAHPLIDLTLTWITFYFFLPE